MKEKISIGCVLLAIFILSLLTFLHSTSEVVAVDSAIVGNVVIGQTGKVVDARLFYKGYLQKEALELKYIKREGWFIVDSNYTPTVMWRLEYWLDWQARIVYNEEPVVNSCYYQKVEHINRFFEYFSEDITEIIVETPRGSSTIRWGEE